ncbi:MAG: polyphosphate polymerase domain-containing protein [Thermodesulfovibrionia bacterium]|nr:polyphosphate polymerase domain-containing protein [Thermodesulfovibrionia bacterium]
MIVSHLDSDKYRFERKYLITSLSKHDIELFIKLHPAIFSEIYRERFVNSIYFDSFNMKHYFDHVNGTKSRVKIRIRWYGDLLGEIPSPVLEIKKKEGSLSKKISYPLKKFSLSNEFNCDILWDVLKKSVVPDALKLELTCLQPVLIIHYRRKYFQSSDFSYRMTIDSNIEYYRFGSNYNNIMFRVVNSDNIILELKYDQNRSDSAEQITNHFPFRMVKNSKYIRGIEELYL